MTFYPIQVRYMFLSYCKRVGWKRFILMVIGNLLLGLGVAVFKLSAMGTDPFNGMNMAVSAVIGISYPMFQALLNVALFLIELVAGRKLIGIGTIVNAFLLGYMASFFYWLLGLVTVPPEMLPVRVVTVCIGVLITSLGLSLYQSSDVGVAPYDALAIMMDRRFSRIPYFWCRMMTDGACALVCFLAGGVIGLGTLLTVFCLGPFVHFFDRHLTGRFLK